MLDRGGKAEAVPHVAADTEGALPHAVLPSLVQIALQLQGARLWRRKGGG